MMNPKHISVAFALTLATTWLPDFSVLAQTAPGQSNTPTASSPAGGALQPLVRPDTSGVDPVDGSDSNKVAAAVDSKEQARRKEIADVVRSVLAEQLSGSGSYSPWKTVPKGLSTKEFQQLYAKQGFRLRGRSDKSIDVDSQAYIGQLWNTRGYDGHEFDDLLSRCDRVLPSLQQAVNEASLKYSYGSGMGAAQILKDALDNAVGGDRTKVYDFAPLPQTQQAIYFADFIAGVLMDSVQDQLKDKPETAGDVAFLGIRQLYGIIFWSAKNLDAPWREFHRLSYEFENPYEYDYRLPPIYFNNFRELAQKFLTMVVPDGRNPEDLLVALQSGDTDVPITPLMANDTVELKFTQSVLFSAAHLLDKSVFRREFWFQISELVSLHDQIDDLLNSSSDERYLQVAQVRATLKWIARSIPTVEWRPYLPGCKKECDIRHHHHADGCPNAGKYLDDQGRLVDEQGHVLDGDRYGRP